MTIAQKTCYYCSNNTGPLSPIGDGEFGLCQECHGIRLLYEEACEEDGTEPEDEGLSLYIRAFRQGSMKGLHRFSDRARQSILQLELHQATLPHMVKHILDESFVASAFPTKADWNEDRLARIEKLVESLIY